SHPAGEPSEPSHPPRRPRDRRFTLALLSVLGVLALVVAVLGAVSLVQGPRIAQVQVDPQQAIETSGSRVILSANQRLDPVDAAQVTVSPAVPFTVDAAGRSIGIRFTVPLDDATTYTVSIADAAAVGGGPASDLTTSFTTPASRILLLQRSADDDDKIFSTDLTGKRAAPVFAHPHIDDYRAASNLLVVAVEEEDGSHLLVMNRDGSDRRELKLPGEGFVSSVQVSDRGSLVGYSYSDRELTETSGRASVLVTQPLSGKGEPRIVQVDGAEASVAEWQFVPDSSSLLFIDFNGALGVEDRSTDAGVQGMGIAASILGVSRGTYTAIVERSDGSIVQLDLTSGDESALPASDPDYGDADTIVPFPGGTLRHIVQRDGDGMPTGQAIVQVDDDGAATVITDVSGADAILQTCVSPSGQYAAVVVAPDLPNNPYDTLQLPLPSILHTRLIDLGGDRDLPTLSGFDISWCAQAPQP
ncbi:MAG TPA: Ig-like domain-containing protein, partial [Microbacterium sp.]|nr:Ig-like domain-containing protein [Microbacterium sp.]